MIGDQIKIILGLFAGFLSKIKKLDSIEIWGDGKQTRSFLYIDDCIEGTLKLFNSNHPQ